MSSSAPNTYFKFSIMDILGSSLDRENECFVCQVKSDGELNSIFYKNVRVKGTVTECLENGFTIDDGSGVIKCVYQDDSHVVEPPAIGNFVDVIGSVVPQIPLYISALNFIVKFDPLEEVRHMLEQASTHRDYFKFQFLTDDSFLTSEPDVPNSLNQSFQTIKDFFVSNQGRGIKREEIIEICGNTEIAESAINKLQEDYFIYEDGGLFYKL